MTSYKVYTYIYTAVYCSTLTDRQFSRREIADRCPRRAPAAKRRCGEQPGPAANCHSSAGYMSLGLLNVCSAVRMAALIHDVTAEHHLDILATTETWISSDAPNAVKFDVAPPGYSVVHRHRGSSADRRGGGIALVHPDTIKATRHRRRRLYRDRGANCEAGRPQVHASGGRQCLPSSWNRHVDFY